MEIQFKKSRASRCTMNGSEIFSAFLLVFMIHLCRGDWFSEWMSPIREKFSSHISPEKQYYKYENEKSEEKVKATDGADMFEGQIHTPLMPVMNITPSAQIPNLKTLLESVLRKAKALADNLKTQITIVEKRERALKEAIVNGRFGTTTVTVSTVRRLPRKYIIREGFWTLCNGVIQLPTLSSDGTTKDFNDIYEAPRCIGQEVTSKPDRCVFNSVIKYETVPTRRLAEYAEDDYLCLKPSFNNTLERYSSVPKRLVDQTCKNGVVRTIDDNVMECGLRVVSDYTYYPNKDADTLNLPLEYCEGNLGSCKLIIAWHLSNSSIENFEYIKDDPSFKNYFIKAGSIVNHALY